MHAREGLAGERPLFFEPRDRVVLDLVDTRQQVPVADVPVAPLAGDGRRELRPIGFGSGTGPPPLTDELLGATVGAGSVDPVHPGGERGIQDAQGVVPERLHASVLGQRRPVAGIDVRRATQHGGADGPRRPSRLADSCDPGQHNTPEQFVRGWYAGCQRGLLALMGAAGYRYWPVLEAVSMAREPSDCLPDTRVRM